MKSVSGGEEQSSMFPICQDPCGSGSQSDEKLPCCGKGIHAKCHKT